MPVSYTHLDVYKRQVTWTSDDDKKIEATVKKNKDVKIDEVN